MNVKVSIDEFNEYKFLVSPILYLIREILSHLIFQHSKSFHFTIFYDF